MARLLELSDRRSRVTLAPELGGAVAGFEALTPDGPAPVLRGWDGSDSPFALACNVLVPFSNRISGGGFAFDGVFHAIAPNLDGEPFPIHGDGFQRPWAVARSSRTEALLSLPDGAIGPYRYSARLAYALREGTLTAELAVTNAGPRLPFGGGFHPWLPRSEATRLSFDATGLWLEDDRHLPGDHLDLAAAPGWDFTRPRPLPAGWVNNAFTGWRGPARLDQPEIGISVTVSAPELDVAILFSPSDAADFLCFEPVSHAVDAVNQPGHQGMRVLDPGATLTLGMAIGWSATRP